MKRALFAVLSLLVCSALHAQTHVKLSFTGSPSLNWMSSDEKQIEKGQAIPGYDFGINADFFMGDKSQYSLGTGLLICSAGGQLVFKTDKNFDFANESLQPYTKVKYFLRYIEVPTVLRMKTSQFHRTSYWGQFGLSNFLNIQAKGTSNDEVLNKSNINSEVNMFNVALNVGLGFEYDLGGNNAFTVGLIFKNGLVDITSNEAFHDRTIMNTLKLNLGIVF